MRAVRVVPGTCSVSNAAAISPRKPIMIDAGIDAAASLWGVRLGRKFTKTARAILYIGRGNRVVDEPQKSMELCPARISLCGNGRLSAWQDFRVYHSERTTKPSASTIQRASLSQSTTLLPCGSYSLLMRCLPKAVKAVVAPVRACAWCFRYASGLRRLKS